jgi:hypothetical protein
LKTAVSNSRTAASFCSKLATAYSFSFTSTVLPICADRVWVLTPAFFAHVAKLRRITWKIAQPNPMGSSRGSIWRFQTLSRLSGVPFSDGNSHRPEHFQNENFVKLFHNAILWAAGR